MEPTGSYLITASGRRVDIPHPLPGQVTIEDIATHLSRIPRFVGATRYHYSVAQHSVVTAYLAVAVSEYESRNAPVPNHVEHTVRRDMLAEGLLHDAHEYLTGDCPTPLKRLLQPRYGEVVGHIDAAIRREFDLQLWCPANVKRADAIALLLEDAILREGGMRNHGNFIEALEDWHHVKGADGDWYKLAHEMAREKWTSEDAEKAFLREWKCIND